jgi:hypothetical protein
VAIATAQHEHFPAGTVLFLDQEEGGRLLPEQADYLFGWTEAVARSAYKPGAYVSGQAVDDGPGKKITTAQDIREHVASKHLHPVALWIYDDACPPSMWWLGSTPSRHAAKRSQRHARRPTIPQEIAPFRIFLPYLSI